MCNDNRLWIPLYGIVLVFVTLEQEGGVCVREMFGTLIMALVCGMYQGACVSLTILIIDKIL